MSYHSRRILTPGASRKRKEREESFYLSQPSSPVTAVSVTKATTSKETDPVSSNRLLAGYMAHEFLTKGTLLGQEFDPARAEAVPVNKAGELRRAKPGQSQGFGSEPSGKSEPRNQSYAAVASLLKTDGAHILGVVNPTQLARWIQM